PAPVAAGFYGPKRRASLQYFVWLLDSEGLWLIPLRQNFGVRFSRLQQDRPALEPHTDLVQRDVRSHRARAGASPRWLAHRRRTATQAPRLQVDRRFASVGTSQTIDSPMR